MTNKKRFQKADRNVAQKVIRTEGDLIKEVGVDSRESLEKIVQAFTEAEVSVRFDTDGVLVHSLDSDPTIQHKLVYPFKVRTFYVSINWVQVTADLTKHVTYAIDSEESVV